MKHIAVRVLSGFLIAGCLLVLGTRGSGDIAPPEPDRVAPSPSPSPSPSPVTFTESASPSAALATQAAPSAAKGASSGTSQKLLYRPLWTTTLDSYGQKVELMRLHAFAVPFGVSVKSGTAHNMRLTFDLAPVLAEVDVLGVTGPCSISGSVVNCAWASLGAGKHLHELTLKPKSSAPSGTAGEISLVATADEASTQPWPLPGRVTISNSDNGADLRFAWNYPSTVSIGNVITVTLTLSNRGPSPGYLDLHLYSEGFELVSGEGCQPDGCKITNLSVGDSRTIPIQVRVVSCQAHLRFPFGSYGSGLDPITTDHPQPTIKVAGQDPGRIGC